MRRHYFYTHRPGQWSVTGTFLRMFAVVVAVAFVFSLGPILGGLVGLLVVLLTVAWIVDRYRGWRGPAHHH